MSGSSLREIVDRVVENDNCSGCGACARLSAAITVELDDGGFMRPRWSPAANDHAVDEAAQVRAFRQVCPGVGVSAPHSTVTGSHPTMGPYVSVWMAWANDPEVRYTGSSGGVLTAMSTFLLQSGSVSSVVGAASGGVQPTRTVTLQLRTRAEVLSAAGSRYAPVANVSDFDPADAASAFIGKPCEAYAARRLVDLKVGASASAPVIMSFFCAGVPSQRATEELIADLGIDPAEVTSLRYRGNGWPGHFDVSDTRGNRRQITYEASWGAHLGPTLQGRCKICPDGVGEHADIAVGDYWQTDSEGYPLFEDADGVSVAIARTQRGHDLLLAAQHAGAIILEPLQLDKVAAVQPTQTRRRLTLAGRLAGRRLAGKTIPSFRGYHLIRLALRDPLQSWKFARGAYARARR